VERLFEAYQYGEAGRQIHDFLWGEYCDWYIEACKVRLYDEEEDKAVPRAVLLHVLETALRLLHPFMPFLTEAIWQALPEEVKEGDVLGGQSLGLGTVSQKDSSKCESLMLARWPELNTALLDTQAEEQMELMMALVRGIRNRRAEYNVTPGRRIPTLIAAGDAARFLDEQRAVLCSLAKLDPQRLVIETALESPAHAATVVVGDVVGYLPLAGLVDLEAERERLAKELAEVDERIARSQNLLAGEFAQKAPPRVVQRERDKLTDLQTERSRLKERLAALR
jgi:valyl-tRNA synthetase